MRKAKNFMEAADLIRDCVDEAADAYVTLCVHAGIAASDVICCKLLKKHAHGENHNEAAVLLKEADPGTDKHLLTLLSMKTLAGYGHESTSLDDVKRAGRAADALLKRAEAILRR
jgi:hypothetical protein